MSDNLIARMKEAVACLPFADNVAGHAQTAAVMREAITEIERVRSYEGCDGCSTGDCPHSKMDDCIEAQGAIIAAQVAELARLREDGESDTARLDWWQHVHDFHTKFGCVINERPCLPGDGVDRLRADMENEELGELHTATEAGDLPGVADAIADLIYVLLGRAVSYGIDMRPVWSAVHEANMRKEGGTKRADGKVMKPEGWQPPDIKSILAARTPDDAKGGG